jgi:hypothetical protein
MLFSVLSERLFYKLSLFWTRYLNNVLYLITSLPVDDFPVVAITGAPPKSALFVAPFSFYLCHLEKLLL